MNSVKAKINILILGLTSVGMFLLLMLPASLSANHFRYGTMSWEPISDNGTHITIRLKMQNGWTANHSSFRSSGDYNGLWVPGYVGSIKNNYYAVDWGDGTSASNMDHKILSRDNTTPSESNSDCSSNCVDSTISEMGEYSSGTWTTGLTHSYPDNGTYLISWGASARSGVENNNGDDWRNKTQVILGGAYDGNKSPVSAVPPIVQVQDNNTFNYQLVATDGNGDSLSYRWGTKAEFFNSSGNFIEPTGMTLSSSGLVSWDVRDTVLCSGCTQNDVNDKDDLWVAVVMVEDKLDNGSVKSYVPIDFFFKTACPECEPPTIIGIPSTTQTVTIGDNKTFTFTATAITGAAPTLSVLNPPSDNSSIWSTSSSTSVVNGVNTTTFSVSFIPVSSMDNATYAINIRATDNASMTKDQSLGLKVSSIRNADPTAPTLVSPANGATVTKPVSFQWTKSTDADNDAISYSLYFCTDGGFAGCSGTTVAAGGKLMPPFNQNLQDSMISWPRYLQAAPILKQVSEDLSMIPKWLIMLTAFVLLSGFISFSLKNISHRKLVFMLILLIFFLSLNINSCARSDSSISETAASSNDDNDASSTSTSATVTTNDETYTTSNVTNSTTYYWKVIASDTKGGSAESATWSFTVQ